MLTTQGKAGKIAGTLAVIAVSASLGMLVDWRASGISRYTEDWLVRAREPLPEPDDIAIVAIDELSLASPKKDEILALLQAYLTYHIAGVRTLRSLSLFTNV